MNFFKDLKEEMENETEDLTSEEQFIDTLTEDSFDDFDLSEEDALGIDEDLLAKMELEESLLKEETTEENVEQSLSEATKEKNTAFVKDETASLEATTTEEVSPMVDSGKTTVISKGTVINGSIISDGSLEVFGTVNGDISCLGKLSISGGVKGTSTAAEVYISTSRLDGGISSKGPVKISEGTVVVGDISATSCVVAGAVKGDIDVNGPVVLDSTAVVKGNISSKGIQINNGAVIDGFCAQPYATVDIDSYFGDEE